MGQLEDGLASMSGGSAILLGVVLGLMMAFDMGGPLNKVAYSFAAAGVGGAALATDAPELQIMAAVMLAGMVPPIALALATVLRPGLFTVPERENGKAGWLLGGSFITEGAIPFAAADPLRVIPSIMLGSAVTGGLSMAFEVSVRAPHGGIFVLFAVDGLLGYFVALASGVVVAALAVIALKSDTPRARGLRPYPPSRSLTSRVMSPGSGRWQHEAHGADHRSTGAVATSPATRLGAPATCARRSAASRSPSTTAEVTGDPRQPGPTRSRAGTSAPRASRSRDIHADPDRLRRPVRRDGDYWEEIGWDEAFDLVADGLAGRSAGHGRDAVGIYLGNPNVHSLGSMTHGAGDGARRCGTRNRFSATSVDQLPHQLRRAPDVRPPAVPAGPRHRPHRLLPGLRRQPDGLQRLA